MKVILENWRAYLEEAENSIDSIQVDEGFMSKAKAFFTGWTDTEAFNTIKMIQPVQGAVQSSYHAIEKSANFIPKVKEMENEKLRNMILQKARSLRNIEQALTFLTSQLSAPSSLQESSVTVAQRKQVRQAFLKVYQYFKKVMSGKEQAVLAEQDGTLSDADIDVIHMYDQIFSSSAKKLEQTFNRIIKSSKNIMIKRIANYVVKEAESMLTIQALFSKVLSSKKYSVQTETGLLIKNARKNKGKDLTDEEITTLVQKIETELLEKELGSVMSLEDAASWNLISKISAAKEPVTRKELPLLSRITKKPQSLELPKMVAKLIAKSKAEVRKKIIQDYRTDALKYAKIESPTIFAKWKSQ